MPESRVESLERSESFERAPGHQVEVLLHQVLVDDSTGDYPLLPGGLSRSRAHRKEGLSISEYKTLQDGIEA